MGARTEHGGEPRAQLLGQSRDVGGERLLHSAPWWQLLLHLLHLLHLLPAVGVRLHAELAGRRLLVAIGLPRLQRRVALRSRGGGREVRGDVGNSRIEIVNPSEEHPSVELIAIATN